MSKIGVGIIGCGNISVSYLGLAPSFRALEIRAVADINMAAAQKRADKYGVRAMSVDDLLAAEDIDVVVNLTIPDAHYQVSKRILEAGKHVYSEKPFVLSLEEGEELRRIATEKNLRVGSAPDTWLGGSHQLARALIDEGKIGKVVGGSAHVMNHGMEHWHPNPDFFYKPGAGPVLDLGPYYISDLVQLIGPVKRVQGIANTTIEKRIIGNGPRLGEELEVTTPTNVHAILEFAQGAVVTLSASWDVWAHGHDPIEIYGEDGSLFVPDPNFFGDDVEFQGPGTKRDKVERRDHPFGVANQIHRIEERALANYRCAGLADMAQAIEEGREHRCNLDFALHVVEVMTKILEAGESRQVIEMTTTCERPAALSPEEAQDLLVPVEPPEK
ncbi:Gfo/Idh/MocA family protein [Wenxinia saemankumensis]|uniref:Predicted dehydrogenase n=1 Tax=Wenxinia saemankumensis TaxID=1447782 RepID=A0A1M6G9B8_9RHOB|nr:Gfo/Idh/MocA family oxidoreductase [Wenxinia saemankumensis]SHJ06512.1 Predicted dehydrogenase [Wenxinia saemankumensis]